MKKIVSFRNLKIAQQLLFTSILIMVAVSLLIITYITNSSLNSTNNQYEIQAKANATSVIEKIDRNFYERFGDVQAFAYNKLAVKTAATDSVKQDAQDFINTMVSYYVLYDLMLITDINGKVVAANTKDKNGKPVKTSEIIGKNFSNEEWFRSCTSGTGPEGGAWYSDFMINDLSAKVNSNNGWGMAFAAPIKGLDGSVVGTWYNFANWAEVTQGIRRETQVALNENLPGTFMLVTNSSNEIIDADDSELVDKKILISESNFLNGSTFSLNGKKISNDDFVVGKTTGNGAYTYKGKQWNTLTFIPKAKFNYQYFVNHLLILFIAVIFITAVVCYIFFLLAKSISNNISHLKDDLVVLSMGNLVEAYEVNSDNELGQMSAALKQLVDGLKDKSEFAEKIGSGQLEVNYNALSSDDVLGKSLLSMRENLMNVAADEKKRNWATEGLAKFGDILRGNNEGLEVLADNIISGLVKYLNANQGGLFIVNDNNTSDVHLELLACYAWNKKKYIHMRVEEGEGLVGQAWQEADTLYITDVPDNFVKISSGLGDANPKSFLIVPLTVNDITFGVIEIASFNYFEQYHIDFVNKLAESIASTLSTAKTNEHTKSLLEQSQQQAEEMRAQEEEMRQNMEEMAATQEEMQRKKLEMSTMVERMQQQEEEMRQNMEEMQATQEEMERIQQENQAQNRILDSVAIISKTDLKGNITYVNDEFLKWSKYTKEEVMGKNHRMLKSGDQDDQIFVDMWKTISSGNIFRGEIKNKAKDDSFYWVDAIIAPVLDDSGKPKEYLAQRFVINEQKEKEQETGAQKAILDQICIISKTDLQGNITYVNDEFLKWSKYTKEEVMGKNHRMLKSGDQDDQIFVDMWKTISSGKIFRGEIKNKAKDGSFYWVDAIVAPVLDDKGKPVEYMAQRFVINEQKEKEQETGAQKVILDQICIISKTDLQGNITYVNDEFLKWSKYTKEEVMGKNHRMLKSGDQDDQIFVDMWKTISSGNIFRGEIKNKAKDGSFYWVDAIIAPVLDDKGKPLEYMAQRFVINEQKEKEQETGAQKAILDQICIISKTDLQGNITYVNDEFLKWSKYTKEEVMGKNHRMLKSGDQDDQIFVDMWKTISSGKIFRGEIKNKAKDGSFYWVDAIVAPVLDDKGKPVEYMAQRFVINEQKEKEEKLSELFKKLNNKD